jgi:hypothetical protein
MSAQPLHAFRERLVDAAIALRLLSQRQVLCRITLPFGVPPEHLGGIPLRARDVVCAHAGASFQGARLARIGAEGLEFEVLYRILSTSHANYVDSQESIVRGLVEAAQMPVA